MISATELRHKLHQIPELAFAEHETTKLLRHYIEEMAKECQVKIQIHTPLETGLIVEYTVNENDYYLYRADIDALAIEEQNDCPFKSQNNNMHACGHDVHMAILYGWMQHSFTQKIPQNMIFVFQPAEEGGGGAERIIKSKILDSYNITKAYAIHVTDEYSENTIASTRKTLFASTMEIDAQFTGIACHVAFPHNGRNAFNALRTFLDMVDRIPKNPVDPFIFGIGQIQAGKVRNITPDQAEFHGTIRSLNAEKNKQYFQKLQDIAKNLQETTQVQIKITSDLFYPEVNNTQELFQEAKSKLSPHFNFIDCGHKMTGEDFSYFSQKYPACMFWLGTKYQEKAYGLHHCQFLPRDESIQIGIDLYKNLL